MRVILYFYSNDPFEFITYFDELVKQFDMMSELQSSEEQYAQQEASPELAEGISKIISLLGNHSDPTALSWFREKLVSVSKAKDGDSDINKAESLLKQGELAASKRQPSKALKYFEEILEILNRNPGYKPVRKMLTLMGIAGVFKQEQKWDESWQKANEALVFARQTMGENNLALISVYDHLAKVENERGNLQEAMQMVDEGLRIAYEYAGKEHMAVAILLSTKAVLMQG